VTPRPTCLRAHQHRESLQTVKEPTVSRYASALARPAAIGAHAWTRIARVQPPHAGHTALEGTGIQDRGRGPGRYHGPGPGPGPGSEIITGGSQGRARGRNLGSGDARGPTRGRGPIPILVRGPTRDQSRGRGRAIGEVDTESAHTGLTPKVSPRVAAIVIAENANGGEREVERRMYVYFRFISTLVVLSAGPPQREKRERKKNGMASAAALGGQWGKYGIISESEYGRILYPAEYDVRNFFVAASLPRSQNFAHGLLRSAR
jgi:hypothetical protein